MASAEKILSFKMCDKTSRTGRNRPRSKSINFPIPRSEPCFANGRAAERRYSGTRVPQTQGRRVRGRGRETLLAKSSFWSSPSCESSSYLAPITGCTRRAPCPPHTAAAGLPTPGPAGAPPWPRPADLKQDPSLRCMTTRLLHVQSSTLGVRNNINTSTKYLTSSHQSFQFREHNNMITTTTTIIIYQHQQGVVVCASCARHFKIKNTLDEILTAKHGRMFSPGDPTINLRKP